MGFLRIVLAAFLLQSAAPRQLRMGSIEGTVTGGSGEALSKVTVTLTGPLESIRSFEASPEFLSQSVRNPQTSQAAVPFQFSATTGADGKFAIDNLKPGSYLLLSSKKGYVTAVYGRKAPNGRNVPIALSQGQNVKDIVLEMPPDGAIAGRIIDPDGVTVSRALVQAWQYSYTELGRRLGLVQEVSTDDRGDYRLFWLEPGSYYISTFPSGVQRTSSSMNVTSESSGLNRSELAVFASAMNIGRDVSGLVLGRTLTDGSTDGSEGRRILGWRPTIPAPPQLPKRCRLRSMPVPPSEALISQQSWREPREYVEKRWMEAVDCRLQCWFR